MQKNVRATRNFQSGYAGSREAGEVFGYDWDKDPGNLRKDGAIELEQAAAEAAEAGAEGKPPKPNKG